MKKFGFARFSVLLVCLSALCVIRSSAQDAPTIHIEWRQKPLVDALRQFVSASNVELAYDPGLVEGKTSTCKIQTYQAEDALRCLLARTDLDYIRLSSGTYVLTRRAKETPNFGRFTGIVYDEQSGEPLPYASIQLRPTQIGTSANAGGSFVLPRLLPGTYRVLTSFVGYDSRIDSVLVPPNQSVSTRIYLRPNVTYIEPVVIEDLQFKYGSEKLGSVVAATGEVQGGKTIPIPIDPHVVPALAGVRTDHVTSDVHIQGGEAGEHAFRLDGAPVYIPLSLGRVIGPFSPFALKRITVHKTGFGAMLGSHLSGVILAEHDVPLKPGRHVDVQVDPLSANLRFDRARTRRDGSTVGYMFSGRKSLAPAYQPAYLNRMLDEWRSVDPLLLGSVLDYSNRPDLQDQFVSITEEQVNGINSGSGIPAIRFADVHVAAILQHAPGVQSGASWYLGENQINRSNGGERYRWINQSGQVNHNRLLSDRSYLSLRLRGSAYSLDHRYTDATNLLANASANLPALDVSSVRSLLNTADDGNRIEEWAAEAKIDHTVSRDWFLKGGLDVNLTKNRLFLLEIKSISSSAPAVTSKGSQVRVGTALESQIRLGPSWHTDLGFRTTFLTSSSRFNFEPRAAVRYDAAPSSGHRLAVRVSGGVYRQFVQQFDVSSLSTEVLLPMTRFWLPLDETIDPPAAYQSAVDILWSPSRSIEVRLDGFYRYQPRILLMNFKALFGAVGDVVSIAEQRRFLNQGKAYGYGGAASVTFHGRNWKGNVRYEYHFLKRRNPLRFANQYTDVPWREPHVFGLDWEGEPRNGFLVLVRWQGIMGRTWAFRQAYYDYPDVVDASVFRYFGLGSPDRHVLPFFSQLDLGIVIQKRLPRSTFQVRLDALNATARKNQIEWKIRYTADREEPYKIDPVHAMPFSPSLALRLSW